MTKGELILLRKFSQGVSDLAHLPVEVIKMIIRHLNMRAMLAYNINRALPRYSWADTPYRLENPPPGGRFSFIPPLPFYGPGY